MQRLISLFRNPEEFEFLQPEEEEKPRPSAAEEPPYFQQLLEYLRERNAVARRREKEAQS